MNIKRCFIIAVSSALSYGCMRRIEPLSDKQLANKLLNERKFEEAISLLETMHKDQPSDDETTLLLASAYSGSVGVNVVDSAGILFNSKSRKQSARKKTLGNNLDVKDSVADDLIKFLSAFEIYLTMFYSIPHTPLDQRPRLIESILLASTISEESTKAKSAVAYLALLNLVQFLNYMKDAVPINSEENLPSSLEMICGLNIEVFSKNFDKSLEFLTEGLAYLTKMHLKKETVDTDVIVNLEQQAKALRLKYSENQSNISGTNVLFSFTKPSFCPKN